MLRSLENILNRRSKACLDSNKTNQMNSRSPSLNFFLQSFFYDKVSYQKVLQKFLRGMAHGRLERRRGFAFNQCQKLCQHLYNRMKFASPTLLLFLQVLLLVSKNLSSPSRGGFHLSKEEEAVKRCIFIFLLLALLLQKLTVKQEREKI